jgi:hypothetical protein
MHSIKETQNAGPGTGTLKPSRRDKPRHYMRTQGGQLTTRGALSRSAHRRGSGKRYTNTPSLNTQERFQRQLDDFLTTRAENEQPSSSSFSFFDHVAQKAFDAEDTLDDGLHMSDEEQEDCDDAQTRFTADIGDFDRQRRLSLANAKAMSLQSNAKRQQEERLGSSKHATATSNKDANTGSFDGQNSKLADFFSSDAGGSPHRSNKRSGAGTVVTEKSERTLDRATLEQRSVAEDDVLSVFQWSVNDNATTVTSRSSKSAPLMATNPTPDSSQHSSSHHSSHHSKHGRSSSRKKGASASVADGKDKDRDSSRTKHRSSSNKRDRGGKEDKKVRSSSSSRRQEKRDKGKEKITRGSRSVSETKLVSSINSNSSSIKTAIDTIGSGNDTGSGGDPRGPVRNSSFHPVSSPTSSGILSELTTSEITNLELEPRVAILHKLLADHATCRVEYDAACGHAGPRFKPKPKGILKKSRLGKGLGAASRGINNSNSLQSQDTKIGFQLDTKETPRDDGPSDTVVKDANAEKEDKQVVEVEGEEEEEEEEVEEEEEEEEKETPILSEDVQKLVNKIPQPTRKHLMIKRNSMLSTTSMMSDTSMYILQFDTTNKAQGYTRNFKTEKGAGSNVAIKHFDGTRVQGKIVEMPPGMLQKVDEGFTGSTHPKEVTATTTTSSIIRSNNNHNTNDKEDTIADDMDWAEASGVFDEVPTVKETRVPVQRKGPSMRKFIPAILKKMTSSLHSDVPRQQSQSKLYEEFNQSIGSAFSDHDDMSYFSDGIVDKVDDIIVDADDFSDDGTTRSE